MSDPTDYFAVIAQIAAAFAGFGSLASGLGKRRGGDDARMDAYRLRSMLSASLSATMLALLPVTLAGLAGSATSGVHAAAAIAAGAILLFTPANMARASRIRHVVGFSRLATTMNLLCVWGAFVAFACCLFHEPHGREAAWYLLGLMGLLASSLTLFARVIVSMLSPYQGQATVRASGADGDRSAFEQSLRRPESPFPEVDVATGVLDVRRPAHRADEEPGEKPAE